MLKPHRPIPIPLLAKKLQSLLDRIAVYFFTRHFLFTHHDVINHRLVSLVYFHLNEPVDLPCPYVHRV